jgi:hypothetical protein
MTLGVEVIPSLFMFFLVGVKLSLVEYYLIIASKISLKAKNSWRG